MTVPQSPDELHPALRAAEEELIERVDEACSLEPEAPLEESTGQLMRLEDALVAAAHAAEQAVGLRQQRRALAARAEEERPARVREFRDPSGREWRAWAVTPSRSERTGRAVEMLQEEFPQGWLAFESMDGTERRRLTNFPSDWAGRSEIELDELLKLAAPVTKRRREGGAADSLDRPPR